MDLQKPSRNPDFFKAMELRLISLGFQAGASDEVMEKLAEQYEEKSTDSVSHIVSILEPTIVYRPFNFGRTGPSFCYDAAAGTVI